jgi:hypothetical protein
MPGADVTVCRSAPVLEALFSYDDGLLEKRWLYSAKTWDALP